MTLRHDELRAVEALVQFMTSIYEESQVSWKEPEKDPPDADMTINDTYYAVEVTTIPEIYTLGLPEPQKSKAVVGTQQNIVKKIETQASSKGILTGRYYISFYVPKPQGDIDTKEIIKQALNYIEKTQNQKTSEKYVISGNRFKHAWIQKTGNDESFVQSPFTPVLGDFPEDIAPSCEALEHVLDEKSFLESWPDPAILIILHDPITRLADIYQQCSHLREKLEKFHSVFIVSNTVTCPHQMLYSKEPAWLGN